MWQRPLRYERGRPGFPGTRRTAISLSQLVHSPKAHAWSSWPLWIYIFKKLLFSLLNLRWVMLLLLEIHVEIFTSCFVSGEIRTVLLWYVCRCRQLLSGITPASPPFTIFFLGYRVSVHHLPSLANLARKATPDSHSGKKNNLRLGTRMANNADWMTMYGIRRRRRYGFDKKRAWWWAGRIKGLEVDNYTPSGGYPPIQHGAVHVTFPCFHVSRNSIFRIQMLVGVASSLSKTFLISWPDEQQDCCPNLRLSAG